MSVCVCVCVPLQRLKAEKKQFKEVVCRMFMDQLKPHYQAGKFRTPVSAGMPSPVTHTSRSNLPLVILLCRRTTLTC